MVPANIVNLLLRFSTLEEKIERKFDNADILSYGVEPLGNWKQIAPNLYANEDYRFEGWGYVFPFGVQFWVKHVPSGQSKRIVQNLFG